MKTSTLFESLGAIAFWVSSMVSVWYFTHCWLYVACVYLLLPIFMGLLYSRVKSLLKRGRGTNYPLED